MTRRQLAALLISSTILGIVLCGLLFEWYPIVTKYADVDIRTGRLRRRRVYAGQVLDMGGTPCDNLGRDSRPSCEGNADR